MGHRSCMLNEDKMVSLKTVINRRSIISDIARMLHVTICLNIYTIVKAVSHSYMWFKILQQNVLKAGSVSLWAKSPSLKWILLSTFLRFASCDNKWKDCEKTVCSRQEQSNLYCIVRSSTLIKAIWREQVRCFTCHGVFSLFLWGVKRAV